MADVGTACRLSLHNTSSLLYLNGESNSPVNRASAAVLPALAHDTDRSGGRQKQLNEKNQTGHLLACVKNIIAPLHMHILLWDCL